MKYLKFTFLLVGVISLVLLQSPVYAQDDLIAPLDSPINEGNSELFPHIPSVFSASKYEQKVTKAPASISIVTADEIKKWGYRTFDQILASLKGFYTTRDRNNAYVGARGFGLPSDNNSRVLLLIDGHRFNDNIFEAFDASEFFPIDIDVIERVEVVRGPSSSLYGTNAVFGVINVITKRGRDLNGVNIKSSYGTNDALKNSISVGKRFNNGIEAFVTGTFYESEGFNRLFYKEFESQNNGLSIGNDGEQSRKLMAKLAYGDFSFQGLHVDRTKDIPTASFGRAFNSHEQTFIDQANFFELKYDHTFDNQLNIQSRISYNNYRLRGDIPLAFLAPNKQPPVNNLLFYGEWWRAEIEASKLMWDDHHITFGGQFQGNFNQNLINFDTQQTYLNKDEKTYQWALYIQDDYGITDNLTLNAGVRFDYYSIFGSTINPRVGLIYNPWLNTTFKLLYGEAFRAPNQFELNYEVQNVQNANPKLQPETLDTLEFIIEHYFTRQLRGEFNVFRTNIQDNIIATAVGGGVVKNQNARNVESTGVEAQIENNWENGFQGRLSYSWQQTINKDTGERLSNSPEHMVKLNLIAPLWQDRVFLGFETQFMSSRKVPPKFPGGSVGRVNDYVVSNLTFFTQNWLKGLELSAGAYNIFDVRYFDPASADHDQNAIQQDGITFRVKASYDF